MNSFYKFIIGFVLLLFCAGCNITPDKNEPRHDPLDGTRWKLQSIFGYEMMEGSTITLEFAESKMSGSSGCNFYGATYAVQQDLGREISTSWISTGIGWRAKSCRKW